MLLGGGDAGATTWTVQIRDGSYNPQSITITMGDTVTWVNTGTRNHTSTSDSGVWDSGIIAPGGTYDRTFSDAHGIFRYHDSFDQFGGEVIVQVPPTSPTPTPSATATPAPSATPTPTATATASPSPTPTAPPPTATPSPTPSGTPGPTPTGGPTSTPGNLCYPEGDIAIYIPVLELYVWIDGVWQETNGYFGLQRDPFVCEDGRILPPDTQLIGLGA